ncbi:MAG: hypothetical protein QXR65_08175 [Candidatus Bathyarchaeia archaeon]
MTGRELDRRKMGQLAFTGVLLAILLSLGSLFFWVSSVDAQEVSERGILVQGDEKVLIEGAYLILTGNITVKDNGTLILKESTVQLSIRGEEDYNVSISGNGRILLENSTLLSLSEASHILLSGMGNLTLASGSRLDGFKALTSDGACGVAVRNGRIIVKEISGRMDSLRLEDAESNGVIGVEADEFHTSGFKGSTVKVRCREAVISDSKFTSLAVNASGTVKLSRVESGDSLISSYGGFRLEDSSFKSLTLGGEGEAYNVATKSGSSLKAGGQIHALPNSTVRRFWYLTLTVTDIAGVAVPAKIHIYYVNGTEALQVQADILGRAYTPVLAEMVNSSRALFVGNYLVEASYMNYSTGPTPFAMDSNKELKLRFKDVIPIPTTTHIGVSRLKIRVGEKLKVSGWIEAPLTGELVEITYRRPEGLEVKKAVRTVEDGRFADEFTPDTPGAWTVYAEWLGGSSYAKDKQTTSRPVVFIVEARPPIHEVAVRLMPILIIVVALIIGLAYVGLQKKKTS